MMRLMRLLLLLLLLHGTSQMLLLLLLLLAFVRKLAPCRRCDGGGAASFGVSIMRVAFIQTNHLIISLN